MLFSLRSARLKRCPVVNESTKHCAFASDKQETPHQIYQVGEDRTEKSVIFRAAGQKKASCFCNKKKKRYNKAGAVVYLDLDDVASVLSRLMCF